MSTRPPGRAELPTDRLTTSDAKGHRVYVYPADIGGRFHRARRWLHALLLVVFLGLPWVRIGGHQALLLDIASRRFAIFGVTFWAHDAPMLVFFFGGGVLTLGLVTALWGRVWCGWACPQTVFIEAVFRRIERAIEGDHLARRRLDAGEWGPGKAARKALKWALFVAVTLVISHSFVAYFVGTEELARMIRRSPFENPASFLVMAGVTAGILFDFGWFREQFCTVLCPYARFQSLLMDAHSKLIVYDARRGEPRKGTAPESAPRGDCVDCFRCVQVCPAGIDIRRGTQLECIGCTACIDACDDVMARLDKPRGLVRYDSAMGLAGGQPKILRARTVAYTLLLALVGTGLIATLATRRPVEAAFVRAVDTPYQELKVDGAEPQILNRFTISVSNQGTKELSLVFHAAGDPAGISLITAQVPLALKAGARARADVFVKFPKRLLVSGHAALRIELLDQAGPSAATAAQPLLTEEVSLVGPFF